MQHDQHAPFPPRGGPPPHMGGMPPGGFRGGPPPPMPFSRGGYGGANLAPPIFTPHLVVRKVTADDMYKKEIEAAEKRSALQLAFVYMCDHNKPLGQFLDGLETNIITIISNSAEDRVRSYFEANVVKHQLLNVEQFRNTDLQAKVVVLSGELAGFDEADALKLAAFVEGGGTLLSFNESIVALNKAFPNILKYKAGHTTADKSIQIQVNEQEPESALFKASAESARQQQLFRRAGLQRFFVHESSAEIVTTLAQETQPSQMPLAVRFNRGSGVVYHVVSSHLFSQHLIPEEVRAQYYKLNQKDYSKRILSHVEATTQPKIHPATRSSWRLAFYTGMYESVHEAIKIVPSVEMTFDLLRKVLQK